MRELTRRERNKLECRERILKASRRLFSTKGYEQTTIEDVAEKAEISKATLYNYFTSKESLLLGIAEAELEDIRKLTNTELFSETSAMMKLRRVLRCFTLDSANYIALTRKITCLNSDPSSELYPTRERMLSLFRKLAIEGQQLGELRTDVSPDDIVELLMGVYLVPQFQWVGVSELSALECARRLDHLFDLAMGSVLLWPHEIYMLSRALALRAGDKVFLDSLNGPVAKCNGKIAIFIGYFAKHEKMRDIAPFAKYAIAAKIEEEAI